MNKKVLILIFILSALIVVAFYLDLKIQKNEKALLNVVYLDVGQGDSIFIEAPNGYQVLIDGGKNSDVLKSLSKEMSFYDKEIDLVIATHFDTDHIGGLIDIFDRYKVKNFADYGFSDDGDLIKKLEEKIANENLNSRIVLRSGQRIMIDQKNNIYLDILWPIENYSTADRNNLSVVAELVYRESEFLFTGDAGIIIENILIKAFDKKLETDILKLGHHGSKTSSSNEFLKKTNPKYAIISAGADNQYGHPNKEVIDALKVNQISYFETAKNGNIKIISDGRDEVVFVQNQKNPALGEDFSNLNEKEILYNVRFFQSFINTIFVNGF